MAEAINNGNLSHDFFINISQKLDEVSDVFSKTKETNSVSVVFLELSDYLKKLNLEDIKPKNLQAFDYLSNILSDVSMYLLDMFVDRIFKDVYLFKDSLQNNVEFMKNALEGVEENEGKLDFF